MNMLTRWRRRREIANRCPRCDGAGVVVSHHTELPRAAQPAFAPRASITCGRCLGSGLR